MVDDTRAGKKSSKPNSPSTRRLAASITSLVGGIRVKVADNQQGGYVRAKAVQGQKMLLSEARRGVAAYGLEYKARTVSGQAHADEPTEADADANGALAVAQAENTGGAP